MNYEKYIVTYLDNCETVARVLQQIKNIERPEIIRDLQYLVKIEESAQRKVLSDFEIWDKDMTYSICVSDCCAIFLRADKKINERCSALISILSKISYELLLQGIFIRGAITYGDLYLDKEQHLFFGPAMNEVTQLEKNLVNYPRILLFRALIEQLKYPLEQKMNLYPYHQYIERFSAGVVGLSPLIFLQVMQTATCIFADEQQLMSQLMAVREKILENLDKHMENPHIFEKINWLKDRFNALAIPNINFPQIVDTDIADAHHNIHYKTVNKMLRG